MYLCEKIYEIPLPGSQDHYSGQNFGRKTLHNKISRIFYQSLCVYQD